MCSLDPNQTRSILLLKILNLCWHLLYNKDGNRISYLDNAVPHAENVSAFDLEKARHVFGWCSEVKYYAGRNHVEIVKGHFC